MRSASTPSLENLRVILKRKGHLRLAEVASGKSIPNYFIESGQQRLRGRRGPRTRVLEGRRLVENTRVEGGSLTREEILENGVGSEVVWEREVEFGWGEGLDRLHHWVGWEVDGVESRQESLGWWCHHRLCGRLAGRCVRSVCALRRLLRLAGGVGAVAVVAVLLVSEACFVVAVGSPSPENTLVFILKGVLEVRLTILQRQSAGHQTRGLRAPDGRDDVGARRT